MSEILNNRTKEFSGCMFCNDVIPKGCVYCSDPILDPETAFEQRWYAFQEKKKFTVHKKGTGIINNKGVNLHNFQDKK